MRFCSFLLLFICLPLMGQSKLEKSKKELNAAHEQQQLKVSEDENRSFFTTLFWDYGLKPISYVFIGNYNNENHLSHYVAPYPFYNGESGNYEGYDTIKKIGFRFDLEDNLIYSNPDLYGNHLKLKIRPFEHFYVQADYFQLREINKIDDLNYRLPLFYFSVAYDRLRFEKFNLGWNIGLSYVGNSVRKAGLSYGFSADYFIAEKYSIYGSAKWSQINTQSVNAFEIGGKLHRKNFFVSMGFEHLKIATPTYNFIAIGGGIYF